MELLEMTILGKIFDGLLLLISGVVLFVLRRLIKHNDILKDHDTAHALCEQRDEQRTVQRKEDRALRDKQRAEDNKRTDGHHKLIMGKLDNIMNK